MTPYESALLRAKIVEQETSISLADQAAMALSDWSRLHYGLTPGQMAIKALQADVTEPQFPADPQPMEYAEPQDLGGTRPNRPGGVRPMAR